MFLLTKALLPFSVHFNCPVAGSNGPNWRPNLIWSKQAKMTKQTFFTWIWTYDAHTLKPFSVTLPSRRTYLSRTIFFGTTEKSFKPFYSWPIASPALLYYPAKITRWALEFSEWLVSQRLSIISVQPTKMQTHNSAYFTFTQLQTKQKLP